jgi:N utilization substance protein A
MDTQSFNSAIDQICEEKGISKEKVIETIEMAIAAAYKKDFGKKGQNILAKFDLVSGRADIFQVRQVLDKTMIKTEEEIAAEEAAIVKGEPRPVASRHQRPSRNGDEASVSSEMEEKKVRFNAEKHIMVDEAKKEKKDIKVGEELWLSLESKGDFGRIAAQTAKQVIIQRIRWHIISGGADCRRILSFWPADTRINFRGAERCQGAGDYFIANPRENGSQAF